MNITYQTKRSIEAKVAFLGLFVVALLIGRLIISLRSVVILSEPIKLTHAGLSVAMPEGNGWKSEKQWKYHNNSFSINSKFLPEPDKLAAYAHCRYLLAAKTTTPQTRFEQEALSGAGTIAETGRIQTDTFTFDWAHIQQPGPWENVFLGTAKLPLNRQLDIRVQGAVTDAGLAEIPFKRIINSFRLDDTPLLEAGSQIVAKIKAKGLSSFLENQRRQVLFLIKTETVDARKRTLGFTMDEFIDAGPDAESNIHVVGLLHTKSFLVQKQVTSFKSNNSFDEFTWNLQTSAASIDTHISLDKTGVMTIKKSDTTSKAPGAPDGENRCRPSPAAIPNILLEQLLTQMLDEHKKDVIVDIIEANGTITPTYVRKTELEDNAVNKEMSYLLKLMPIDGRGYFRWVYLNDQKQISKVLLQQEDIYILERTTVENVVGLFPEWAKFIMQSNKPKEIPEGPQ